MITASPRGPYSRPAPTAAWHRRGLLRLGLRRTLTGALLGLVALPAAQAHLMVAQRGTLNFVGDGAFMVLSLPVSAFGGVDDDGDGKLSTTELGAHRSIIASAVTSEVKLLDERGPCPLEGLLLSLAPPDDASPRLATHLIVMGRFGLAGTSSSLRFQVGLFGKQAAERTLQITATRASKTQLLVLTPQQSAGTVFPPS